MALDYSISLKMVRSLQLFEKMHFSAFLSNERNSFVSIKIAPNFESPTPSNGPIQNDEYEESSVNQAIPTQSSSNPNFPNPSAINLNIPPIIAQTLEIAAAAPPPPSPLPLSSLNYNPEPIASSTDDKPMIPNDAVDFDNEEHTQKSPATYSSSIAQHSAQTTASPLDGSTNTNSSTKPTEAAKPHRPIFLFGNPFYYASIYNQYNTFMPYPFYLNVPSQTHKYRTKSKRKSSKKSKPRKNVVININ